MKKKILGIERNIFFVGLTSFLTDTTTKMVYAVMPMFLLSLGASKTELSLIEGVAESTASLLKAVSGWWSDKIGRNKPFMVLGYAFTAVLSPLFAFAATPLQVLAVRFTERVGKGIRTAPRDSLVAGSSRECDKGKNFGFHKAMDNSGAIAGPLIASAVLLFFPDDFRKVFFIAAIPGLLGLANVILFVKEAKKSRGELPGRIHFKDFSKDFYLFLGIVFIFTLGNSTDALLLVKAGDVGVSDAFIPIIYLVFNAVSVLFSVPAGMLSDKIGRDRLIIFGYLIYSAIYFGFGAAGSPSAMALLFAAYGIYSAATDGVQKALVSDIVDKDKLGTGLGLYNCLLGVTLLPASVIAGLLYDKVNNSAPFFYGSALALIASALMLVYYRRRKAAATC
jgi:MFS family permease